MTYSRKSAAEREVVADARRPAGKSGWPSCRASKHADPSKSRERGRRDARRQIPPGRRCPRIHRRPATIPECSCPIGPPKLDCMHEMHGKSQHECDRGKELVSDAIIEIVDQPLEPGDPPRGPLSVGLKAAHDGRQERRFKFLPFDDRQDLPQDGQSRRGPFGVCSASRSASVRRGHDAVDDQSQQKRRKAHVRDACHDYVPIEQAARTTAPIRTPRLTGRAGLGPADRPVLVEIVVNFCVEDGHAFTQIDVMAEFLTACWRMRIVSADAGATSHSASVSSPRRVRAWQSNSKSEPWPKRSRSSA